jgi:hypothetical protein
MYFLNTDYIDLVVHKDANLSVQDQDEPLQSGCGSYSDPLDG